LLLAFAFLEKRSYAIASLLIVLTAFIKIFGLAAMLLYLFYPKKERLVAYTVLWTLILAGIPLMVISLDQLSFVYEAWYNQITHDYAKYAGMSFYSFTRKLSGLEVNKTLVLGASFLVLVSPLIQTKKWRELWFRKLTLASLLIWVVIFNHKAESPSYAIAMIGITFWYFSVPRKHGDTVLLLSAIFIVSILFSDLTPRLFRNNYSYPYHLKVLPTTLIWIRIVVEMWQKKAEGFETIPLVTTAQTV
jgi:hypothetical protein